MPRYLFFAIFKTYSTESASTYRSIYRIISPRVSYQHVRESSLFWLFLSFKQPSVQFAPNGRRYVTATLIEIEIEVCICNENHQHLLLSICCYASQSMQKNACIRACVRSYNINRNGQNAIMTERKVGKIHCALNTGKIITVDRFQSQTEFKSFRWQCFVM